MAGRQLGDLRPNQVVCPDCGEVFTAVDEDGNPIPDENHLHDQGSDPIPDEDHQQSSVSPFVSIISRFVRLVGLSSTAPPAATICNPAAQAVFDFRPNENSNQNCSPNVNMDLSHPAPESARSCLPSRPPFSHESMRRLDVPVFHGAGMSSQNFRQPLTSDASLSVAPESGRNCLPSRPPSSHESVRRLDVPGFHSAGMSSQNFRQPLTSDASLSVAPSTSQGGKSRLKHVEQCTGRSESQKRRRDSDEVSQIGSIRCSPSERSSQTKKMKFNRQEVPNHSRGKDIRRAPIDERNTLLSSTAGMDNQGFRRPLTLRQHSSRYQGGLLSPAVPPTSKSVTNHRGHRGRSEPQKRHRDFDEMSQTGSVSRSDWFDCHTPSEQQSQLKGKSDRNRSHIPYHPSQQDFASADSELDLEISLARLDLEQHLLPEEDWYRYVQDWVNRHEDWNEMDSLLSPDLSCDCKNGNTKAKDRIFQEWISETKKALENFQASCRNVGFQTETSNSAVTVPDATISSLKEGEEVLFSIQETLGSDSEPEDQ